jgi:hypothetical protein
MDYNETRNIFEEDWTMFEKTPRNSGRYPWKTQTESVGHRLDCLLNELVRQDHAKDAHDILEPLLGSAFNLLDDNTVSTEIKALAADFLRTYGEDWTASFDERTNTRIKELLGE